MNEKTKAPTATTGLDNILWRVGYSWVNNHYQLRQGTLVIPATTANEANEKAKIALAEQSLNAYRLTKTVPY